MGMYRKPLVSENFEAPLSKYFDSYIFLPLTVDHVELDYEAVMDNRNEDGLSLYPTHTLKQNLIDLGYHQKEHQKGASYTYTILDIDKDTCIGCIYIYPSTTRIEVDAWVRDLYKSLESEIFENIKAWIGSEDWLLVEVDYLF